MIIKIGLILYAIITVVHLCFAFLGKDRVREYTKPLLMLTLVIISLIYMSKTKVNIWILLAVIFALSGDIFLIFEHHKFLFISGTVSYFISMILYSINIIKWLPFKLEGYFYLILVLFLCVWFVLVFWRLYKQLKWLSCFYTIYGYIYVIGISLGLIAVLTVLNKYSLMIVAGFSFLFLSDSILISMLLDKKLKKGAFYLTILYAIGQALLLIGNLCI